MAYTDDVLAEALDVLNNNPELAAEPVQEQPSVDDQIASELAGSPTTGAPYQPNPKQWDDSVEGSIVEGNAPGSIEMEPEVMRKQGTSGSVSTSRSGMRGGANQVEGLFAAGEQRAAGTLAAMEPGFKAQEKNATENYGALKTGFAEEFAATEKHHAENAAIFDRLDKVNDGHQKLLQRINADGKILKEAAITEYREQLAAVRVMAQQDANPLHSLGAGETLGLVGAKFAEGFLAAQGININVSEQIDRIVERSLSEHKNKVQNARQDAEDQLHIYDIARQTSQDDYEALLRYRGMVIESAKVKIEAQAERFNSKIASARAKQAQAKLDMDLEENVMKIGDRRNAAHVAVNKMEADKAAAKGKLMLDQEGQRISWANSNETRRHNKAIEDAAKKAKEDKPKLLKIQDTGNVQRDPKTGKVISGGKFTWFINPNLPEGIQSQARKDATDAQQLQGNLLENLADLRDLKKKVEGTGGPDWWKNRSSQEYRTYVAQLNLTAASVLKHYSGAASAEPEAQRFLKQLEPEQWFASGNNDILIENLDRWGRKKFQTAMKAPGIETLPENEQTYDVIQTVNPAGKATEDVNFSSEKPVKSFADKAFDLATDTQANTDLKTGIDKETNKEDFFDAAAKRVPASPAWKKLMPDFKDQPENADVVMLLVEGALNPAALRNEHYKALGDVPDNDDEVVKQSMETLERIGQARHQYGENAHFAQRWLTTIKHDPEGAKELLQKRPSAW